MQTRLIQPVNNINIAPIVRMIGKKVKTAELALEDAGVLVPNIKHFFLPMTEAPNEGIYHLSPLRELADLLMNNDFDTESACDLGGGLGGAAALLKIFFKKVVAWEIDQVLCKESRILWGNIGFPYNQIDFHNENFLMTANIGDFKFIHFYMPFMKQFAPLMRNLLLNASKGAKIAFPELDPRIEEEIFAGRQFKKYLEYSLYRVFERN